MLYIVMAKADYRFLYFLLYSFRIMGPIFFTLFAVLIYFIILNMFLAIIGSSYEEVNSINNTVK